MVRCLYAKSHEVLKPLDWPVEWLTDALATLCWSNISAIWSIWYYIYLCETLQDLAARRLMASWKETLDTSVFRVTALTRLGASIRTNSDLYICATTPTRIILFRAVLLMSILYCPATIYFVSTIWQCQHNLYAVYGQFWCAQSFAMTGVSLFLSGKDNKSGKDGHIVNNSKWLIAQ